MRGRGRDKVPTVPCAPAGARRGRAASAASCHLTTERAWLVRQAWHGLCPEVYAAAEGCPVPSELAKRGRPESGGL